MSDQNSDQEKTEEPTQHKLEEARKDGNVSVSKEISSVAVLTTAVIMFVAMGSVIAGQISHLFETFFSNAGRGFGNKDGAISYLSEALWAGVGAIAPILVVLVAITIIVNVAQT